MRWTRSVGASLLAAALGLAGLPSGGSAHAHGGSVTWGFYFGAPAWPYYGAPYYYPPAYSYYYNPWYYPGYSYPEAPAVYVEQAAQAAPAAPQPGWWYYCADLKAYYPYVKQCPGQWQPVSPTPPGVKP